VTHLTKGAFVPQELIEELPAKIEASLTRILGAEEKVHVKLKGAFKEGLICTDSRVIILKSGFMTGQIFGTDTFQQTYAAISGVQVKYNLMSGYFEVSAGGMQNSVKSYWSSDKNADPSKAPNCVSLNSKAQKANFQAAASFITNKLGEIRLAGQSTQAAPAASPQSEALAALHQLGALKEAGILTEEEFATKKADLLSRL
jgi:hypothetical protein